MKRNLLKSVLLSSLFGFLNSYAAPAWVAPFQVGVPAYPAGVEFTVTGLYLQPTTKISDYATETIPASSLNGQTYNQFAADYGYSPGIIVGLGYIFPNTGNDVQITYTYYKGSSDTYNIGSPGAFINPINPLFPDVNFNEASDTSTFTFNVVDITAGQFLSVGRNLLNRLYAGIRIVDAEREDFVHMDRFNIQNALYINQNPDTTIVGAGPRLGIDSNYRVFKNIGFTGRAAIFLLATEQKTDVNVYLDTPVTRPSNTYVNLQDDIDTIWGYEYRLGFNVTIPLNQNSLVRFELGEAVTTTRTNSAGGLNGPFLNMFVKV